MKFSTLAKQFGIASLAMAVAVGCSSNAKKDDAEAVMEDKAAMAQSEADAAKAAAMQAKADAAKAAAMQAEADARARAAAATSNSSQGTIDYTVASGDSLWSIAGKGQTYGNPYAWPLIYKANKAQIKDADLIFAGQVFAVDTAASSSDLDAAIQHAKTRGAWSVGEVEASDGDYLAR